MPALFSKGRLWDFLEDRKRQLRLDVAALSANEVLEASDDRLLEHFLSRERIEAIRLYPDRQQSHLDEISIQSRNHFDYDIPRRSTITLPGVALTVEIPWTGARGLWGLTHDSHRIPLPVGEVAERDRVPVLRLCARAPQRDAEGTKLQQEINTTIASIQECVAAQQRQIEAFYREIPRVIGDSVRARREMAEKIQGVATSLQIPLNQRPGTPVMTPIPVERRMVVPLPAPTQASGKPEPGITGESFELILSALRGQGRTFERTPATFRQFDEEGLRDIILANLNTHFIDRATGETFSRLGKTDIHIPEEGRSAFIGECKVWGGEKELVGGLEQLLGYLTWRHCKTALIVFNKDRAKFSELREKAPQALRAAPLYLHDLQQSPEEGEWRMLFRSREDDAHEIAVHLFLFNLYVPSPQK